jgi:signal transduction histidine kinase
MWTPTPELSRRAFGGGYLVGTGVTLAAILLVRLLRFQAGHPVVRFATVTGAVAAVSLVVTGYWIARGTLSDRQVWRLCQFAGLGIGSVTLLGVTLVVGGLGAPSERLTADVLVSNAALGGMASLCVAGAREFHHDRQRIERLEQYNAILGRILRHNVRNEVNVIVGTVESMQPTARHRQSQWLDRIERHARRLHRLSENARWVSSTLDRHDRPTHSVDLVPVVERTVEAVSQRTQDVSFATDLPPRAIVRADGLLPALVENLIENAVVHPEEATVSLSVERVTIEGASRVKLTVSDDGPGIPEHEIKVLECGRETPLQHGSGLGLWLVRWLVDRYGGDVSIDTSSGSTVTVSFRQEEPSRRKQC